MKLETLCLTFLMISVEGALGQLANILPDYILPFAITVLSHSNLLEDRTNIQELVVVEKCLNFVLEPLINNKDTFCFSLYKNMIEKMKNAKSAFQPLNDEVNEVSWEARFALRWTVAASEQCVIQRSLVASLKQSFVLRCLTFLSFVENLDSLRPLTAHHSDEA